MRHNKQDRSAQHFAQRSRILALVQRQVPEGDPPPLPLPRALRRAPHGRRTWRKISRRSTTGTRPDWMKDCSTEPGPTGGSWSESPAPPAPPGPLALRTSPCPPQPRALPRPRRPRRPEGRMP